MTHFVQFGIVRKAFLPRLRKKRIAIILRYLGRKELKLMRKNSKKLLKLFQRGDDNTQTVAACVVMGVLSQ